MLSESYVRRVAVIEHCKILLWRVLIPNSGQLELLYFLTVVVAEDWKKAFFENRA